MRLGMMKEIHSARVCERCVFSSRSLVRDVSGWTECAALSQKNGKARLIDAKRRTRCPPRFRLVITACTRATRWLHFFFSLSLASKNALHAWPSRTVAALATPHSSWSTRQNLKKNTTYLPNLKSNGQHGRNVCGPAAAMGKR